MSTLLKDLSVSNLALIQDLDLEFGEGFNVITGPTGSGKTMLIEALKLAFGDRADYDLLQESADARIEVSFEVGDDTESPFRESDQDTLTFEREIKQNHTSPAQLNGERVRLKTLRRNRTSLIDFHGQHDNQAVFESDFPREVLDRFGEHGELLDQYQDKYQKYKELESELESLQGDNSQLDQRLELLEFQLSELEEFSPEEEEWDSIEEHRIKLESTEDIQEKLNQSLNILEGQDDLQTNLKTLSDHVNELAEYESDLESWIEELNGASVLVEELRRELNELRQELSGSRQDYDELMDRRSRWMELARKHNVPPENLFSEYKSLQQEKENLENREERKAEITDQLESMEDSLYELADQLHDRREDCASSLESSVVDTLERLNLENAIFNIEIEKRDLGPTGYDKVRWLFSSHESQAVGPLSTRVSGGEISRVLLAIKSALAGADKTSVLVFDEIDAGISGEEAKRVGDVLKELSEYHQVLCITHLPLVASRADHHIRVRRQDRDDSVTVDAETLERNDKVEELSRLLSGNESSDVSREQAEALLEKNS
jgi:DNA repair protein RecN (Recombination protein N)